MGNLAGLFCVLSEVRWDRGRPAVPDMEETMHPADAGEAPRADTDPGIAEPAGTSPPPPTAPLPVVPRGWSRRNKILAWAAGSLAVVLLLAATGAYLIYRHLNANLHQVNVSGLLGSRPVDLHPKAQNVLVIGSDSRIGNGQLSAAQTFKINEAFTIGNLYGNKTALGTACVLKTVERDTGIRIDHFVVVNFDGLKDMANAVGGVPECNTSPINDPKSGLHLTAGHHMLNGRRALAYVRARYTLGNGSDLERINRQQAFMSALVSRVKAKELNPLALYRFLDAATKSITIDSQLGGIHGLYDLATSLKNLPPGKVTFFTLPTYPRSYVDPADTANLLWTQPQDSLIFQAFRRDVPVSHALLKNPRLPHLSRAKVAVMVLNGTTKLGVQDSVGSVLQQDGFNVRHTRAARKHAVSHTVIRYHAGQEAEALLLAKDVHGASLSQVSGPSEALGTGHITLLLGSDYGTTVTVGPAASPQPASTFTPRTASQNICTGG